MAEMAIGIAAGLAAAAACAVFYWLGLKAGKRRRPAQASADDTPQSALMRKYEAIMDYDPYGERV